MSPFDRPDSPFTVQPLICAVVSRALLRLTANSSLAAPRSTAVFCFRFRGP